MNNFGLNKSGKTLFLCLCLVILINVSCQSDHGQDSNQNGNNLPYRIDLGKIINGDLLYSTFIEDIEYIKLETNLEHLIGEGSAYPCPDGFMIKDRENELAVFSKEGRYLTTIGKKGAGPTEYPYANFPQIDYVQNRVYFQFNTSTVARYSLDGHFLDKFDVQDFGKIWRIIYDGNNFQISGLFNTQQEVYHPFGIYSKEGELEELISLDLPEANSINFSPAAEFHMSIDNKVLVYNIYPDTIHYLNEDKQLLPYLILDLDGNGIKYNERFNFEQKMKRRGNHSDVKILGDYGSILIFQVTINGDLFLAFFNKQNSDIIKLNGYMVNQDPISWLVNDIDGGPGTCYFSCDNNYNGYTLVQAIDLIALYESGKIDEAVIKSPKKRKQLIELIKTLDENDNPVVMKVKFKKL